jgi:haloacetate dehalogenase
LWGQRGVVQALFDPLALWRAQCSATVQGLVMPAGHFIPEELPFETAQQLLRFFKST